MYSSKFAAEVSRHMMPRLHLPVRWGSESSRECGEEADFVSDCSECGQDFRLISLIKLLVGIVLLSKE